MPVALLPHRAVLEVSGPDRVTFLQGLLSNDVTQVARGQAQWTALLTPQGKWQAEFFLFADGERLLLDAEADRAAETAKHLARFRLRAKVVVQVLAGWAVYAGWGGAALPCTVAAPDPRLPMAGWRALAPAGDLSPDAGFADWDAHRLALGLPDGARDLDQGQTVLLEAGFDALNGISWTKGCYMGQELTARTRYRGLLKRRLAPVRVAGPLPARGTPVLLEGEEVGEMRSGLGDRGIALLRLAAQAPGIRLACGEAQLEVLAPAWDPATGSG